MANEKTNNYYNENSSGVRPDTSSRSYHDDNCNQTLPKKKLFFKRVEDKKEFSNVGSNHHLNVRNNYKNNPKNTSYSSNYNSLPENKFHGPTLLKQNNCSQREHVDNNCSIHWVDDHKLSEMKFNIIKVVKDKYLNQYPTDSLKNYNTKTFPTQDDALALRKQKNVERRQRKKEEKLQLKAIVSGVQVAKPDFSLEQLAEDFPSLNSVKKCKKVTKNSTCMINPTDSTNHGTDSTSAVVIYSKLSEKSWKPKVKDPICFSLEQALHSTNEKVKSAIQKTEPDSQRNVRIGNVLDSDNPQLKKGKVRPDKEKRPSKLKEKILMERSNRRGGCKDNNESNLSSSHVPSADIERNDNPICKDISLVLERYPFLHIGCECKNTPNLYKENNLSDTVQLEHNFLDSSVNQREDMGSAMIVTAPQEPITLLHEECRKSEIDNDNSNINVPLQITKIHSRKFREYCTNCLTEDLTTAVCDMLEKVAYFQDRAFARDPIRANAKRRYVAGINQTYKFLKVNKVKLLVIAPDLEKNNCEGGLDERITNFIIEAKQQNIPCVFGPNRKRLGKAVFKHTLVSCVAILSYEGAEDQLSKVIEALQDAKSKYQYLTDYSEQSMEIDQNSSLPQNTNESCVSADEITASLLASLREDISPAEKLLNALTQCR